MTTKVGKVKTKRTKTRKRYAAVDVWQSQFGPVSVSAVFDIYSQKFNVPMHEMKNYKFFQCIDALRLLEDPEYVSPHK